MPPEKSGKDVYLVCCVTKAAVVNRPIRSKPDNVTLLFNLMVTHGLGANVGRLETAAGMSSGTNASPTALRSFSHKLVARCLTLNN